MPIKLQTHKKEKICAMFSGGDSIKRISEETGHAQATVRNVLVEYGLKDNPNKSSVGRICPNCKAKEHNPKARFCWKCGEDIRSQSVILQDRLRKILPDIIQMLPESLANEASDTIQDTIKYLQKE